MHHHRRVVHPMGKSGRCCCRKWPPRCYSWGGTICRKHSGEAGTPVPLHPFPWSTGTTVAPLPASIHRKGCRVRPAWKRKSLPDRYCRTSSMYQKQRGGEAEVPFHKLRRILGTVHARQIEDKVSLSAMNIQFGRVTVHVIFVKYSSHLQCTVIPQAFPSRMLCSWDTRFPADKPSGASQANFHKLMGWMGWKS